MRRRARPRLTGAACLLAAAGAVLWCLPHAPAAGAAAGGGFTLTKLAELDIDASVPLVVDSASRRVIELADDKLIALDGTTFKEVARTPLAPYKLLPNTGGSPTVYGWTAGQKRLYLLVYGPLGGGAFDGEKTQPYLAVVNPANLAVESVRAITPAPFPAGIVPMGMNYYPAENKLYIAAQTPDPLLGDHSVMLSEINVSTAKPTWSRAFSVGSACQKLVTTERQTAVNRLNGSNHVYFGCGTGNLIATPEPGSPGVVRVDITNPANITALRFPVAGSYSQGESLSDPGHGRLVLVSKGPGVPSQSAWIFDEAHEAIVGVISAGKLNVLSSGLDPESGRLYVGIDKAVLASTQLGLKIPQAVQAPLAVSSRPPSLTVVPFSHRLLIAQTSADLKSHTFVYENSLGDYVTPPDSDADAGTVNVAEAPGVTSANYGGDAKAYGFRVHEVAGANGVAQNIQPSQGDYWTLVGGQTNLNDGDRNLYFARTIRARLDQGEASASAVNTDGDANTQGDYKILTKGAWPYQSAACADLGGGKETKTAPESSVTCDAAGESVTVTVTHENNKVLPAGGESATPLVSMGWATSATTIKRDPALGVVVETTAEARDVLIAGVAHFGRIISKSRSIAHGRPGTADATYSRVFQNVSMPGYTCPNNCDTEAVASAFNSALGPSFNAELPEFKEIRTPKGARGAALRDEWKHQQDTVLNNEEETSLEVPALRITWINDNASRSRSIFDFAATMANSAYAIYKIPSFDLGPDDDGGPLPDLLAGSSVIPEAVDLGPDFSPEQISAPPTPRVPAGSLAKRLGRPFRLLFTGRRALLLNALLWSLLVMPVFLFGRRRHLLRLIGDGPR